MLVCEAYFHFLPTVWIMFVIILYEGLLGGACYVNAFYRISKEVRHTSFPAVNSLLWCGFIVAVLCQASMENTSCPFRNSNVFGRWNYSAVKKKKNVFKRRFGWFHCPSHLVKANMVDPMYCYYVTTFRHYGNCTNKIVLQMLGKTFPGTIAYA